MTSIWASKRFFASCDVDLDVKVHLGTLELRDVADAPVDGSEYTITVQLIDGVVPLHPTSRSSGLCIIENSRLIWNEWITLPFKIKDLPQTAQLVLRVWDDRNSCIAGASMRIFDFNLKMNRGYTSAVIWRRNVDLEDLLNNVENVTLEEVSSLLVRIDNMTPIIKAIEKRSVGDVPSNPWVDRMLLEKLQVDMLDQIEKSDADLKYNSSLTSTESKVYDKSDAFHEHLYGFSPDMISKSTNLNPDSTFDSNIVSELCDYLDDEDDILKNLPSSQRSIVDRLVVGYLGVTFPVLEHPVLWEETRYPNSTFQSEPPLVVVPRNPAAAIVSQSAEVAANPSSHSNILFELVMDPKSEVISNNQIMSGTLPLTSNQMNVLSNLSAGVSYWGENLGLIDDSVDENIMNPTDIKHHKYLRSGISSTSDVNAKPNRQELQRLNAILSVPDLEFKPTADTRDYIWRYRYTLQQNKKSIVKFISTVDFNDEDEAKEAEFLLSGWAPLDVEDALRLLLPEYSSLSIRRLAFAAISRVNDAELSLYLLQIVQCCRYEPSLLEWYTNADTNTNIQQFIIENAEVLKETSELTLNDVLSIRFNSVDTSPNVPSPQSVPLGLRNSANKHSSSFRANQYSGSGTMNNGENEAVPTETSSFIPPSILVDFLFRRCAQSHELSIFLYWFLRVGETDATLGILYSAVLKSYFLFLLNGGGNKPIQFYHYILHLLQKQTTFLDRVNAAVSEATASKRDSVKEKIAKLNNLLLPSSSSYSDIATFAPLPSPMCPSIVVQGIVPNGAHIFKSALYPAVITLNVSPSSSVVWDTPSSFPCGFSLSNASKKALAGEYTSEVPQVPSSSIKSAIDSLKEVRKAIADSSVISTITQASSSSTTVPAMDSADSVEVSTGSSSSNNVGSSLVSSGLGGTSSAVTAVAGGSGVGTNALSPQVEQMVAQSALAGTPIATYKILIKTGDDLRQDQLIIQMLRLCDMLLKRVGLDMCLTPYSVLATGHEKGIMELVLDSLPLSAVNEMHKNNPIQSFLRAAYPDSAAEFGISEEVMQTYIRSCAGYCVATYLLGVGDRHLDNIMLRKTGHLFHLDFGYIFGRDPKPMPPPMRITKEMIDGMGGPTHANYNKFRSLCCQTYNVLRKSSSLFTVLLTLMKDAGIGDLQPHPLITIAKLHEKFRVDIDDEAADQVFLRLVDNSVQALFPAIFEVIHKIRVAMR